MPPLEPISSPSDTPEPEVRDASNASNEIPESLVRDSCLKLVPVLTAHDLAHRQFKESQRKYFAERLERKWECEIPGHTICWRTVDGQHHQLSEVGFAAWVDALVRIHALSEDSDMKCPQCLGDTSTAQPPPGVLNTSASLSGENASSASVPGVVSVAPSLAPTASLRESLSMLSLSSWASSGIPGPGYYSGKAFKWVGENILNGMDRVIIMGKTYRYTSRLKRLQKRHPGYPKLSLEEGELWLEVQEALEKFRSVNVYKLAGWTDRRVFRPQYFPEYAKHIVGQLENVFFSKRDSQAITRFNVSISPL